MCRLKTDQTQKALSQFDYAHSESHADADAEVSYLHCRPWPVTLNLQHKGLPLRFAQHSRQEAVKDKDQRSIVTSDPHILTSPAI